MSFWAQNLIVLKYITCYKIPLYLVCACFDHHIFTSKCTLYFNRSNLDTCIPLNSRLFGKIFCEIKASCNTNKDITLETLVTFGFKIIACATKSWIDLNALAINYKSIDTKSYHTNYNHYQHFFYWSNNLNLTTIR